MTDNRTAALMFFLACVTLAFCVVQARGCIEKPTRRRHSLASVRTPRGTVDERRAPLTPKRGGVGPLFFLLLDTVCAWVYERTPMALRHVTISIRTTRKLAAAVRKLAKEARKTRSRYIEDVLRLLVGSKING